jgi:hypothetical protein
MKNRLNAGFFVMEIHRIMTFHQLVRICEPCLLIKKYTCSILIANETALFDFLY